MEKYITIREQIKAKNIEASNLFLRKLWSELQMIRENGWFYQPFRKPGENRVYIGRCNFGDVSFDYKNKGCIENMYFENVKAGEEQGIRDAIRKARDIEDINDFYVRIDIPNQGTGICCETDGKTGCVVKKDRTSIYMQMQAYGAKDLEYLLNKKVVVLCNILMLFVVRLVPLASPSSPRIRAFPKSLCSSCGCSGSARFSQPPSSRLWT